MRYALPVLLALSLPAFAQNLIAPTEAKTPAEEQKSFKVPAGFEVQLVASEPDIGKPIQIAHDAKGRLWVTTSRHYPFAAEGKSTDKLYVLSEIGEDGKAKKVTTFADDLNIPIGILPLPDCKSCIVSECGKILKLTDTDGDGKADKRETLFSGFGFRDTHGMYNSFTYLPDGWVYACHGFNNESDVVAKDGSRIKLQSGNTFRFKPDGSRIEQWTHGQVNPFGMTVDPFGNLYTADCHTKPITQLIRGAYYESFGKPHDGLGYAPHVTPHSHNSTGLCGLAWYDADHFPKEFQSCLFLGNVVTNRINADRITWKGATPVAEELPDFLVSSDPWFRPTDIKLGMDGALYFADFYNKIIGHYEVDLKHPGRDKDRGRVWRIVYKGADGKGKLSASKDLTLLSGEALTIEGGVPNLATRLLAKQHAVTRGRANGGQDFHPITAAEAREMVIQSRLEAEFRRRAVDALIGSPSPDNIAPLVELLKTMPKEDTYLRFAARVALRNALREKGAWDVAMKADPAVIADVAVAVPTAESAAFLLTRVQAGPLDPKLCEYIGRYGDEATEEALLAGLDRAKSESATSVALAAFVRGLLIQKGNLRAKLAAPIIRICLTGIEHRDPAATAAAIEVAGALKLDELFEGLTKFAAQNDRGLPLRGNALAALLSINSAKALPIVSRTLTDSSAPPALRDRAAQSLAGSNQPAARDALIATLQTAPTSLATVIATALAGSPASATALLDAIKAGKASPRLLQEKVVSTKLLAIERGKLKPRIDELTKGLPSADAKTNALIRTRAAGFLKAKPDLEVGKKLFTQHCANCHQIGGMGAKIGPQLDGIGSRGADRLCEDVLDPNRNIDAAFRATQLSLLDGRTIVGLLIREEGKVLVLADPLGKEIRIEDKDIDKRTTSVLSPMPANVETLIPEGDFYHLLAYLLEQRVKKE